MGIIYFIKCLETNEIYIGSTKRTLKDRINGHRKQVNHPRPTCSKQIIDRGNYIYDVLEEVEDNDKLLEREQYHIDNTDCINIINPFGFNKKEYDKEYSKKYREENYEKEKVRWNKYNQANLEKYKEVITCECGNTFTLRNKARHMKTKKHLLGIHNREQSIL